MDPPATDMIPETFASTASAIFPPDLADPSSPAGVSRVTDTIILPSRKGSNLTPGFGKATTRIPRGSSYASLPWTPCIAEVPASDRCARLQSLFTFPCPPFSRLTRLSSTRGQTRFIVPGSFSMCDRGYDGIEMSINWGSPLPSALSGSPKSALLPTVRITKRSGWTHFCAASMIWSFVTL